MVVTVRVELPPEVTDAGANVTWAPAGAPVADRATDCALPLVTTVDTVPVAVEPATTEPEVGLTASEKSFGGAVTVSV